MRHKHRFAIRKRQLKNTPFRVIIGKLLLYIFLIGLISIFWLVWQNIRQSVWDRIHQFNLVIQKDEVLVYSYHPEDQFLNILIIPEKTYIPAAHSLGDYPIGNLYTLGNLEKLGGGHFLAQSVQNLLAVPIDGYIKLKTGCLLKTNSLEDGKLTNLLGCVLKGQVDTNLKWRDLLNMVWKFNSLSLNQVKDLDFSKTGFIKEEVLPDQSIILSPDYFSIDQLSLQLFSDKTALNEGIAVSVSNGTDVAGLARDAGRLIKNFGADLISTDDATDNFDKSVIYYKNPKIKDSHTFKKLIKVYKINKMVLNDQIGEDINLVIGKDFKLRL